MNQLSILLVVLAALITSACSSTSEKSDPFPVERPRGIGGTGDDLNPLAERQREQRLSQIEASQFYERARQRLEASDYASAIENYDELSTRHPFSEFTTQGELERIYALYRSFDYERSLSSAERFLREHPRHPSVDYIHYVKGLINFSRDDSALNFLPIDPSKGDVSGHRRAFDEFSLLVQRYPNSSYAGDAYQRMVFIRNRLAAHELHVVDYYVRRGAYVAASKRAEQVVARYPGTPASYRALHMLVTCYELAGLKQQARDAQALVDAQDPVLMAAMRDAEIAELSTTVSLDGTPAAGLPPENEGFLSGLFGLFSSNSDDEPSARPALTREDVDAVAELPAKAGLPEALEPKQVRDAPPAAAPETRRQVKTKLQEPESRAKANTKAAAAEVKQASESVTGKIEKAESTAEEADGAPYTSRLDEDGYQVIQLKQAGRLGEVKAADEYRNEQFFETGDEAESRSETEAKQAQDSAIIEGETGMKLDSSFRLKLPRN